LLIFLRLLATHVDVVLPRKLLLIDLESRTDGEYTEGRTRLQRMSDVRSSSRDLKRSKVTVVFGVALRGRSEPRGQHKDMYQQELISLRLETEDAVRQTAETGHAYQTGGCCRNVLEISVRQYGRPKSRRMVQR
jgi:hypothetical protein